MQSRRISSAKWPPGWPALWRRPTCWAPTTASASASSGRAPAAREILREALACPNAECIGAADVYTRRLEDVKNIAPDAKTYLDYRHLLEDKRHRRGADRHAAAPARGALHGRARCRQARLPGKDHGVHGGARQAHARGLPARRRQAHRPDRPPVDLHRADGRRRSASSSPS